MEGVNMSTRNTILEKSRSFIGVTENPANSNNVIFNTDYYGHPINGSQYPWCCTFVWDIFNMCNAKKYFYGGKKTASCTTLMNWYKKYKPTWVITDLNRAQSGDIVLFQFNATKRKQGLAGHVGIFDSSYKGSKFYAVEGNTSATDKGSQDNGGCVARKLRNMSQVMCIIHIPYNDDKKVNPYVEPTKIVKYNALTVSIVKQDVKWVQWELCEAGINVVVDGKFGKGTLSAIEKFQRKMNLVVDGKVGPATREAFKSN